jgi:hypothetical protein
MELSFRPGDEGDQTLRAEENDNHQDAGVNDQGSSGPATPQEVIADLG